LQRLQKEINSVASQKIKKELQKVIHSNAWLHCCKIL
jgi:hypothetical protein